MYSGWMKDFPVNRLLRPDEWHARLDRVRSQEVAPDPNLSLVAFNSSYIDLVDRRYRQRGMILSALATAGVPFSIAVGLLGTKLSIERGTFTTAEIVTTVALLLFGFFCAWLLWHLILSKELFTSTYYPIRFNRKTRMVHFHLGNKAGVATVPWEEGFFHIGRGMGETFLNDIRCHVMDGDVVKQTFAIGHYYDDERVVRALWEFIRRYMEDGPDATGLSLQQRYISLSMRPSLFNCYFTVMISASTSPFIGWALMPLLAPLILCRWLVLNTCSVPRWPEEIERESEIAADDPHAWPIPRRNGEFVYDMEGPGAKRS